MMILLFLFPMHRDEVFWEFVFSLAHNCVICVAKWRLWRMRKAYKGFLFLSFKLERHVSAIQVVELVSEEFLCFITLLFLFFMNRAEDFLITNVPDWLILLIFLYSNQGLYFELQE
ncbi:hypothetical protein VNO78_16018 [Psophocarpus tetragonolobus]|uniref:Uncharacterized protein n=1 Tax=Psophocarpus tetragonolobus TaxID=3891 RepID=A0AAN9XKA6_PSOTE